MFEAVSNMPVAGQWQIAVTDKIFIVLQVIWF
jgi:hypothetical protein